ncbi:MAG TPA: DUF4097 family beta strand repeat-containing protein [Gemmatimonadales bacterium]|nr:DUF4097 family beta strand repeat-containing protein [Gemmatimonadales bacterium]
MLFTLAAVATFLVTQQTDTQLPVRPGTRLELSNPHGSIVVRTWAQSAVRVHAEHSEGDQVQITSGSAVLTIGASSRHGMSEEVNYTITVPRSMPLNLSGVHTDIDIDGSEAAVSAQTVNGDVKCRGGKGQISLQSVSGSVALQATDGRMDVHTVSDEIRFTDVQGEISAETVSGDVTLEGVKSSDVEVSTVSGNVLYNGTLLDNGRYRFSTHNGDVAIAIPDKANAAVSVSTFNGDFNSSFPVSVTGSTKQRFNFTLGSGSARIELATFNGDIKLRRPGQLRDEDEDDHDHEHDHDHHDHERQ